MKLKKLGLLTLVALSSFLSSCGCDNSHDENESVNSGDIPEGYIRVFFYEDFTQPDTGECISHVDVLPDSKISKPATPKAVFPDFPVFLGWSYKEVVEDASDLWDFDNDKVNTENGENTFNIYAVWVAEGEA